MTEAKGYPHEAGARSGSTGGTAQAGADRINKAASRARAARKPTLEDLCARCLIDGPKSPEEAQRIIAGWLGRPVLLNSIRPRFSALARRNLVTDSGERSLGEGGRCKAIRWRLTSQVERDGLDWRLNVNNEGGVR